MSINMSVRFAKAFGIGSISAGIGFFAGKYHMQRTTEAKIKELTDS